MKFLLEFCSYCYRIKLGLTSKETAACLKFHDMSSILIEGFQSSSVEPFITEIEDQQNRAELSRKLMVRAVVSNSKNKKEQIGKFAKELSQTIMASITSILCPTKKCRIITALAFLLFRE